MKKLFFIMAMSVCAFTAQAQTTSGIRVGLNMTSATGKYNDLMADQDYNNKSYMGYSIHYFTIDKVDLPDRERSLYFPVALVIFNPTRIPEVVCACAVNAHTDIAMIKNSFFIMQYFY